METTSTHAEWLPRRLDALVDELALSVRAHNCLKNAGLTTLRELVQKTDADLLRLKGLGRGSLRDIQETLREVGFSLGMAVKPSGAPATPEAEPARAAVLEPPPMGPGVAVAADAPRKFRCAYCGVSEERTLLVAPPEPSRVAICTRCIITCLRVALGLERSEPP